MEQKGGGEGEVRLVEGKKRLEEGKGKMAEEERKG